MAATNKTKSDRQRLFAFDVAARETRAERCQRILAGVPGVRRASALRFTESTAREADAIAKRQVKN